MKSVDFALELQALLGLFGVHGSITRRRDRAHVLNGHIVRDGGSAMLKICDSAFLTRVADYMADSGKRGRILQHASTPGQYDVFQMPSALREALELRSAALPAWGAPAARLLSWLSPARCRQPRVLDRWMARFPDLAELVEFALTLRPVRSIERGLPLPENVLRFHGGEAQQLPGRQSGSRGHP